jgi:hypothetical protein
LDVQLLLFGSLMEIGADITRLVQPAGQQWAYRRQMSLKARFFHQSTSER